MIINADVLDWCRDWDGPPAHALLCDAPYEIAMMGREWDASGVSYNPETWRGLARHLLPGAFLFVFAGCLNDDLISVAMRKAGLRKHHKALAWINGASMKKGVRADVQLDNAAFTAWLAVHPVERAALATLRKAARGNPAAKAALLERTAAYKAAAGVAREVVGLHPNPGSTRPRLAMGDGWQDAPSITAPATDLAAVFEGHSYGLQTLKPMAESILIFQKPYEGRPIDSIARTGAGTLNITAGRIPASDVSDAPQYMCMDNNRIAMTGGQWMRRNGGGARAAEGRWPSSVFLAHSPLCRPNGCVEGCGVRAIGEQSGESTSPPVGAMGGGSNSKTLYGAFAGEPHTNGYGDHILQRSSLALP